MMTTGWLGRLRVARGGYISNSSSRAFSSKRPIFPPRLKDLGAKLCRFQLILSKLVLSKYTMPPQTDAGPSDEVTGQNVLPSEYTRNKNPHVDQSAHSLRHSQCRESRK